MRFEVRRASAAASAILCAQVLAACAAPRDGARVNLTRVASGQIEAGGSLRLVGEGFVAGDACELRLRGRTQRPGLVSREVRHAFACHASSEEEVVASIERGDIDALGGHGTFEGELELQFFLAGAGASERAARGALHARFDVLGPIAGGPLREHFLRERARRVLGFAGIELAEEEETLFGLVVGGVRPESRAERLGVRPRDVIVTADGVNLHSLLDLAPAPNAQRLTLEVHRPGAVAAFEFELGLRGLFAPDPGAELSRLSALLAWLLSSVLLLGPLARAASWLAHSLRVLARGKRAELGFWGARRSRSHGGLLLSLALSAAGVFCVWRAPAGVFAVRSFSICCGFVALQIALALLSEQGELRARLRVAAGILARMLVLGIVVGCAFALCGTRSLDGMVEGQGPWPWQWALVQKPALLVAFPLYLSFAGQLGFSSSALTGDPVRAFSGQSLLGLQRVSSNLALAALGAAIFAGGWQFAGELGVADARLVRALGATVFVAKTWSFAWLFSLVRSLGPRARVAWPVVATGCALSVGLCALWLWLEPRPEVELSIGRALFATGVICTLVTATRLLALRLRRYAMPEESA